MPYEKKLILTVSFLLSTFFLISTFFPPFQIGNLFNYMLVFLFVLWLITAFFINNNLIIKLLKKHKLILFLSIYSFLISYAFNNAEIGNRYLTVGVMLSSVIIYKFYNEVSPNINFKVLKYSLVFIIFTVLVTSSRLISNPYLSRSIKETGEYSDQLKLLGVGGYILIYFLVIIQVALLYKIISKNEIRYLGKIMYTLIYLMIILVIFMSNFLTALILVFLSWLIMFINSKKGVIRKFIIYSFIFLSFLFNKALLTIIINTLLFFFKSGNIHYKLSIMLNDIDNGVLFGTAFDERWTTFHDSFNAFYENILFGIISKPIESEGNYLIGFGQHSFIMDTFAIFGFFIGFLFIYAIFKIFKDLYKRQKSKIKKAVLLNAFILLFLILIFNNISFSIAIAFFYYVPVILDINAFNSSTTSTRIYNEGDRNEQT